MYRGQLKQALGVKARLEKQMDSLDISDPHYDRKIADLERRYDEQYGKIEEIETLIADVMEVTFEQSCIFPDGEQIKTSNE